MSVRQCPVCGGEELVDCLAWNRLPVFVNVTAKTEREALQAPTGQLSIVQCTKCGFVFNAAFEPEHVAYCQGYHAEWGDSVVYRTHLDNVCRLIQKTIPQQQGTALEVGCGTGEFLRVLEPCVGQQLSLLGVDPSVQPHQDGRIRFDSYLFDKAHLPQIPSDLVLLISRHMIEHVVNPLEMLRLFACALPDNGVLYLETPRLDWILEQGAFFDFGYEHCAYFTDDFMRRLLAAAGFQILAWKTSYQNQYFSIFATRRRGTPCGAGAILAPTPHNELLRAQEGFSCVKEAYQYAKANFIPSPDAYIWGCAQKGVVWLNLFDPQQQCCVVDANPYKQGKFILGTGHRILAPRELKNRPPKAVFVMNKIYLDEIKAVVSELFPGQFIYFYVVEENIKVLDS